MTSNNDKVKKKLGRPLKNGVEPQSSAARSQEYRRKKQGSVTERHTNMIELISALTSVIINTSDRGILDNRVVNALEQHKCVVKHVIEEVNQEHIFALDKPRLLRSLASVSCRHENDIS